MKIDNLPVIDDIDLRKKNTERIVNSLGEVGDHFKELKKQNRLTFIIGIITSLIMLIFFGSIIYAAFTIQGSSFMDNMIDKDQMAQRYNCTTQEGKSALFRTPDKAKDFLIVYPLATCNYYDIRSTIK